MHVEAIWVDLSLIIYNCHQSQLKTYMTCTDLIDWNDLSYCITNELESISVGINPALVV